jgi:hypothetical protein
MAVQITRDFPPLTELRLTNVEIMREIGQLARESIVRRTRAGQGLAGPLKSYTSGYARLKAAELGTASPVNLSVSGDMLNAITIVALDERSVTLGWDT